ncbi:MAG: SMC family ATPase [Brachybacterium sp.]|nr:SMC family ATPase [Brachybacterium sp.]
MKLHHLHLRGIGPFRGDVSIDFRDLGASGMFLLEGPTGSGKSTILDAVVYGLYGAVAGSGASRDRIRSQFAPPTEPSVIDLVVETSAGIYRVRREPEYQRAKKRGTGTTREQAKAVLWRLTSPDAIDAVIADEAGSGAGLEAMSNRLDEVGGELTRAIGLSREQFTQTVLLPQGEFARFLRARTEERQAVLQRVFGTEMYQEVEKELAEMRRRAKNEVDAARARLGGVVARFLEASGAEEREDDAAGAGGEDSTDGQDGEDGDGRDNAATSAESLREHAEQLRLSESAEAATRISDIVESRARHCTTAAQQATQRLEEARTAHRGAEHTRAVLQRRAALNQLAERLRAAVPQRTTDQGRLRRHELAAPVEGVLRRLRTARDQAEAAGAARVRATEDIQSDHPDLAALLGSEDPVAALTVAGDAATGRAGELRALVDLETALPARTTALTAQREQHTRLTADIEEQAAQLAQRPTDRANLVGRRDTAAGRAEGLTDARLALQETEQRLNAARTAEARRADLDAAEKDRAEAHRSASSAGEHEAELRRRRNAGLAAELAEQLTPDIPCPVCGATEHPAPARPNEGHVTAEQVEAAEADRRAAEQVRAEKDAAAQVARSRLEEAITTATGLTAAEAEDAATSARDRVQDLTAQKALADDLTAQIARHDQDTDQAREKLHRLQTERTALASGIEAATAQLEEDTARLIEGREKHESVAAHRAAHQARAVAAARLREAVVAEQQAMSRVEELAAEERSARETANAAIRKASSADTSATAGARGEGSFDLGAPLGDELRTEQDVLDAVLSPTDRSRIEQALRDHQVEVSRHADGMAEDGVAAAEASEETLRAAETALANHERRVAALAEDAQSAHAAAGQATSAARRTCEAHGALLDAISEVTRVRETSGTIVRVADLATAGSADGERIRLSTYVLMRRFEDVVVAANARLRRFGTADLELVRDTGARGARKTGLDLLVVDRRTDQARVPETLSGGETFFVSLALALGLADIVSAEAGGVQMQTLFIDEGFGSLDPERLDDVVSEIAQIADAGRTVGIVSHVAELKNQISEQIQVRRRPEGTSEVTVRA